jgi:Ca2+-transporting ATPase
MNNIRVRGYQGFQTAWAVFCLAVRKFIKIEGAQWSGAFAYYAFFSLFPLIILSVTVTSTFIDRDRAGAQIISYVETYIPITGAMQSYIFDTISGVIKSRGRATATAILMLVWAAMQTFITLISAINRAWDVEDPHWCLHPLKSLVFLIIMVGSVVIAVTASVGATIAGDWLHQANDLSYSIFAFGCSLLPTLVEFLWLSLFYSHAPHRPTRLAEVWMAALVTTAFLKLAEGAFIIYLKHFATFNAVYGTFGGIMALLLWIYLSGCIFIFGSCLCASQAEVCDVASRDSRR